MCSYLREEAAGVSLPVITYEFTLEWDQSSPYDCVKVE